MASRPNPQLDIGPVDMSCSFVVCDARKIDLPIIYCSATFEHLTGYTNAEIVGQNCRFLQAPDANVTAGIKKAYTDNNAVRYIKTRVVDGQESQVSLINYRKGGQPFINMLTVIPITWDSEEIAYFVGFQIDLVERPNAVLKRSRDGTYSMNYQMSNITRTIPTSSRARPDSFDQMTGIKGSHRPYLRSIRLLMLTISNGEKWFLRQWMTFYM